jgi:Fic family protein
MVTTDIDPRAVEFLLESNAIEGITNIDYRDSAHRQPGRGHWGALLLMLEAAHQYPLFDRQEFGGWGAAIREVKYRPLTLDDICTWQRMITGEQVEAGHALRPDAIGRIRSESLPVDVYVGLHVAPSFSEVPERVHLWLESLYQWLGRQPAPFLTEENVVDGLGGHFQWFEAIHPFVDGNGRVGRLIANYVMTHVLQPLIVFRASERPAYYAAHRNKAAMRVFMADKVRERIRALNGEIVDRENDFGAADLYRTTGGVYLVERHDLLRARAEWARAAEGKA